MQRKIITPENALIRLQNLCVRSEHSVGELHNKLWQWGIAESEAAKIIDRLKAERYVDDSRFAAAYCRQKLLFTRWGKRKIALGLATKRVNRDIIQDVLNNIDDKEYEEILTTTLKAKARQIADYDSYQGRTRLFRAMLSRGFEAPLISKIIKKLE